MSPPEDVNGEQRDRDGDHRPARDVAAEGHEDALDHGDPERDADPAGAQPATDPRAAMVDRACLEGAVGRHASTVPSWNCEPDPAAGAERAPGLVGLVAVMEEAVHDGPGSADVGPEGAEAGELLGVRRRREVVRRERSQVAWAADLLERVLERGAAVFVALLCSARIESGVDRRGRV